MGDNLAQLLYTAFVNASSNVAGGDVPNWASLPSVDREQWERVATKARCEMASRFTAELARLAGNEAWLAELRARWSSS